MTTPNEPRVTTSADRALRPASMGELVASLSTQVSTLINGEIELTKLKAKNFAMRAGAGGALLVVAALLGLYLIGWIFHTVEIAFTHIVPAWAASLIVVGILFVIIAILATIGAILLKKSQKHTPNPKEGLTRDIDALKKGLGK